MKKEEKVDKKMFYPNNKNEPQLNKDINITINNNNFIQHYQLNNNNNNIERMLNINNYPFDYQNNPNNNLFNNVNSSQLQAMMQKINFLDIPEINPNDLNMNINLNQLNMNNLNNINNGFNFNNIKNKDMQLNHPQSNIINNNLNNNNNINVNELNIMPDLQKVFLIKKD